MATSNTTWSAGVGCPRRSRSGKGPNPLTESLQFLDGILPLRRMVEIYERVRERSPHREPEFRPTFERVFGRRMADFPAPLPRLEHDEPRHPFSYRVPGPATDDEIPF
jgi:hypothetical protein